jgi:hypothetical protein
MCTLQNAYKAEKCGACFSPNSLKSSTPIDPSLDSSSVARRQPVIALHPRPTATLSSAPTASIPTMASSDKKVICGACRLQGHNRATAAPLICPMYNTAEEVERRNQKKAEAERKALEKREEAARFEELTRDQIQSAALQEQEVRRILELTARQGEQFRELSEKEAKRKKQAADRAEKRAQRLAR